MRVARLRPVSRASRLHHQSCTRTSRAGSLLSETDEPSGSACSGAPARQRPAHRQLLNPRGADRGRAARGQVYSPPAPDFFPEFQPTTKVETQQEGDPLRETAQLPCVPILL